MRSVCNGFKEAQPWKQEIGASDRCDHRRLPVTPQGRGPAARGYHALITWLIIH